MTYALNVSKANSIHALSMGRMYLYQMLLEHVSDFPIAKNIKCFFADHKCSTINTKIIIFFSCSILYFNQILALCGRPMTQNTQPYARRTNVGSTVENVN